MNQEIQLINAVRYFNNLPHQVKAFKDLQGSIPRSALDKFARTYRGNGIPSVKKTPKGLRPPVTNQEDFIEVIRNRINELGIKLYSGGSQGFGSTIVGVEGVSLNLQAHSDLADKWNDIVFCVMAYPSGKWKIVGPFICTTEPGRYYTINPLNPLGAAYVKTDTKHNAIWVNGWHKDQRNCFIQSGGPIEVVRDTNRDGKRGSKETIQKGYFGRA